MPSGKAHRKISWVTSPLLILGTWAMSGFSFDLEAWSTIGFIATGYILNPIMLSPDMDLVHSDPSDSYRSFEPLWYLYQGIIHRKSLGRNPLSHWPPLSSILRVVYIWLALFIAGLFAVGVLDLIYWGLFEEVFVSWDWIKTAFSYWLLVFTFPQLWFFLWGVVLGDALHLVTDISYSFMRK